MWTNVSFLKAVLEPKTTVKIMVCAEQQKFSVGADVRGSFLDVNPSQRNHVGMSHVTTNLCTKCPASVMWSTENGHKKNYKN